MPSDEYTAVARGALKLKGAKVGKSKKKSKKDKEKKASDVERALATSTSTSTPASGDDARPDEEADRTISRKERREGEEQEGEVENTKTEAERRFAELKRKRVCLNVFAGVVSDRSVPEDVLFAMLTLYCVAKRADRVWARPARAAQDAQGASRGAELAPLETERTPRHAQDRARLDCN